MTKADLVQQATGAVGPRVTKKDCGIVVDAFLGAVKDVRLSGERASRSGDSGPSRYGTARPAPPATQGFSEAHFKTVKYHPNFPGRFADIGAAIDFCRSFFPWYNHEHRHGGIAMLTPADVHHDRARDVLAQRERTLQQAWSEHPERFVQGIPTPQPLPTEVWINPPAAAPTPQSAH